MKRGVRLDLVGSFVLVSLAGCGRGIFQSAEREPWRAEAEVACLKSGAVKESPELVRIDPISGPGACGAQFPLKVAALGERSGSFGFADELPPPGNIGNQPRWPVRPAPRAVTERICKRFRPARGPRQTRDPRGRGSYRTAPAYPSRAPPPPPAPYAPAPYSPAPAAQPRLGPGLGDPVNAVGPVAVKPT